MNQIQSIYNSFLSHFPVGLHPYISIVLGIVLFISIVQVLRKEFLWLILLIILLPASVPILKGIFDALIEVLKYLFGVK